MLKLEKLECVKESGDKTIAACPACRADDADTAGNHLVIFPTGRFGCVRYPGNSPEAKQHRKIILRIAGNGEKRGRTRVVKTPPETFLRLPPTPKPAKPVILGRFGRSSSTLHTCARTHAHKSGKQPSEPSENILKIVAKPFNAIAVSEEPNNMDGTTRNRLQLIEAILMLRDGKGRPTYTRSQIESCVIGLRPHLADHPKNVEMMQRLRQAAKSALSAAQLADRMTKGHRA